MSDHEPGYVTLYESIDLVKMFSELERLEEGIRESLLTTEDQKTLHTLMKESLILKDLFNISLTNGNLKYLLNNLESFKADKYISFIEEQLFRVSSLENQAPEFTTEKS